MFVVFLLFSLFVCLREKVKFVGYKSEEDFGRVGEGERICTKRIILKFKYIFKCSYTHLFMSFSVSQLICCMFRTKLFQLYIISYFAIIFQFENIFICRTASVTLSNIGTLVLYFPFFLFILF